MTRKWMAVGLAILSLLKGAELFPQRREMEARKPVTALALDGGTRVTALTGTRATEAEEAEVLTGEGESLSAACAELRSGSVRHVYLGQVGQILLGEAQSLPAALEFIGRNRELSWNTLLYIVEGDAGATLRGDARRAEEEIGGEDPHGQTVGKVLSRLAEGETALIPVLTAGEGGATPDGWAVVDGNGLLGVLRDNAAEGAELLMGYGTGKTVVLSEGSAELVGVAIRRSKGALSCSLTARATEGSPGGEELARWGEVRLRAAVEQSFGHFGGSGSYIQVKGRLVTGGEKD